ncbi:dTDP-4-amino-4,6-dideoxygalactose transaminase [Pseudoalteromonas citrea]|uniref:dTDP-4-amino-4,6-dideoxygalactose transaminase n=2 Tax=Pseudoalteromonas citrea TaxID=43655 RepID=A0AAD4AMI3_9GAMM|nr:dTDP-4-amino-4,6-dideoxygalactose transaminase [Pseudoalteromonas citrea]KAF7775472.1 dTDP-4-amino-4,6-dideoxygalactose transaminase [Pseudoalteromonas citrea]
MIPFNKPPVTGLELSYIEEAIKSNKLCGDGGFTRKVSELMESKFNAHKVLLTPSCTASLELAAILIDASENDEIIMPSYTFVSTANAFALRGAKIVFVDVDADTMNLSIDAVQRAITSKTKAIVPVHYAGISCDMDKLMALAQKNNIWVIEDAAQGVMAKYKTDYLGTIGHIGCYSFHETKNYTSGGEGGALLINDKELLQRAEIIREKGTNRSQFFRGHVDKYTWQDIGSSYLPSEIQAAYLLAQIENAENINMKRLSIWQQYYEALKPLEQAGHIKLPYIPAFSTHNAHMFFIRLNSQDIRSSLIAHCKAENILTVFHYIPLHSSPAGKKFGRLHGEDNNTTIESEKLLRLPLFYNLEKNEVESVINSILLFFKKSD